MNGRAPGPEIVFTLYRPHAGKADARMTVVRRHHPTLTRLGLATTRVHKRPDVAEIWEEIGAVADFVTLADLPEAKKPFPHFKPFR